ncbi:MAG: Smr/MutS family protein [Proteobacteria bacterium]|nr:Smr/MutS family protein [Pseudomonadota bacterium]
MAKQKKKRRMHDESTKVDDELELIERELFMDAVSNFDHSKVDKEQELYGGPKKANEKKPGGKNRLKDFVTIDLHGLTLQDALSVVDARLTLSGSYSGIAQRFRIITGKGLHSHAGIAVLASEVHRYVLTRYKSRIISIDESPGDVRIGGIPLRGHFDVVLSIK